jgi:DNA topoisomerase-6 subunit B
LFICLDFISIIVRQALVWSKKSTGLPIQVYSSSSTSGQISFYKLDIDVHRNKPNIIASHKLDNPTRWRGTEISVVIKGKWTSYRVWMVGIAFF